MISSRLVTHHFRGQPWRCPLTGGAGHAGGSHPGSDRSHRDRPILADATPRSTRPGRSFVKLDPVPARSRVLAAVLVVVTGARVALAPSHGDADRRPCAAVTTTWIEPVSGSLRICSGNRALIGGCHVSCDLPAGRARAGGRGREPAGSDKSFEPHTARVAGRATWLTSVTSVRQHGSLLSSR